jgi:DNA-binding IclR family transcriptional regulator
MINTDSALERGLNLLEFIAQNPNGSPYQELRKTNIPSASLTRLLRTLVGRGYLTKDSRGWYQLWCSGCVEIRA